MFVLTAEKNLLTVQEKEVLTSGSVNAYCVRFSFSADWDGLDKIAVFRASEESWSVLLDYTNECMIPWETLKKPGANLLCGVYGTREGEIVLPTIWCSLGKILSGAVPGEDAKSPTPDMWEQLLQQSQETVETVRQLREEADSGAFNGPEGPQGEQGPRGETGPAGPQGLPGPEAGVASKISYDNAGTKIESANVQGAMDEIYTSIENIMEYIGYVDKDVAGLCVDYERQSFTRLAGAVGKKQGKDFDVFPMYGDRKRCTVRDNGEIIAFCGDTGYDEDKRNENGENVQVMVYQPAFWYRVVPLVLEKNTESGIGYHIRKANYYVSSIPKPGFKLHPAFYDEDGNPVEYILLSAYEGSMWDDSGKEYVNDNKDTSVTYEKGDLLCSVANQKPISGKLQTIGTKVNLEEMAQNRGAGWHLDTIKSVSANQLLMMIEFGTMNTQTAIGQGVVSCEAGAGNESVHTGATAYIGNGTGQAAQIFHIGSDGSEITDTTPGKLSVAYRGVENPWGNIWKHINGVNIWGNGLMAGGQMYIADNFDFNEKKTDDNYQAVGFTLPNGNGYVNAMGYGKEEYDWVLMPSEIGGTLTDPVGDYCYVSTNVSNYRCARFGGNHSSNLYAGAFYWYCSYSPGTSNQGTGGRLLYIPQRNRV